MLISCPKCKSVYEIEPNVIPPKGREMVCAECGDKFFCKPSDALIEHFISMENIINTKSGSDDVGSDRKNSVLKPLIILLILLIFLSLTVIFLFRQEIVSYFPQTEKICDIAHINCLYTGRNIEFKNVHKQYFTDNGNKMIQITGEVYNYGDYTVLVPDIELQILDEDRNIILSHLQEIDLNRLEAKETLLFKIITKDPDVQHQAVYVIFSEK